MIAVECTCRRRAASEPTTSIVAVNRNVSRSALQCPAAGGMLHAVETSHTRVRRACKGA